MAVKANWARAQFTMLREIPSIMFLLLVSVGLTLCRPSELFGHVVSPLLISIKLGVQVVWEKKEL